MLDDLSPCHLGTTAGIRVNSFLCPSDVVIRQGAKRGFPGSCIVFLNLFHRRRIELYLVYHKRVDGILQIEEEKEYEPLSERNPRH